MLPNNREMNHRCIDINHTLIQPDEHVIYAQEFDDTDYRKDITYIGNISRQGFVLPRNQLLKWFYDSDYDYAIWCDANKSISKPSENDLYNILDALRCGRVEFDVCTMSLGLIVNEQRMALRSDASYLDNVFIVPDICGCYWFHGLIMKNFKKYYSDEYYIDKSCNPKDPVYLPEDVYFTHLLCNYFTVYCCPTISWSTFSNKTSTWQQDKTCYDYPPVDHIKIKTMIQHTQFSSHKRVLPSPISIPRTNRKSIENVTLYKPRKKKPEINTVSLFT